MENLDNKETEIINENKETDIIDDIIAASPAVKRSSGGGGGAKKAVMFFIAFMLLGTLAAAIYAMSNLSPYGVTNDLVFFYGEDKTVICYNNGDKVEIQAELSDYQVSLDGAKAAFLTRPQGEKGSAGQGGKLYYISGNNQPVEVSDDVFAYTLADSGNGMIYWTDFDSIDSVAVLNLFDGKTSTVIRNNAHLSLYIDYAVISPNGKNVFYLTDVKTDFLGDDPFKSTAYISTDGSAGEEYTLKDIEPVAIADDTKYLYYIRHSEEESTFVVQAGLNSSNETNLIKLGSHSQGITICFNKDYSQIVFLDEDDTFISIKAAERVAFSKGSPIGGFVTPEKAQEGGKRAMVYGFDDFRGKVFGTQEGLFLLNKDLDKQRITKSTQNVKMSSNGKRIYYIEDDNLKTTSAVKADGNNPTLAMGVSNYTMGKGGNYYYVDYNKELFRKNKKDSAESEGRKIAELVSANHIKVSGTGAMFFLDENKDLYYSGGNVVEKINSDVTRFDVGNNNVFYYIEKDFGVVDVYRSNGNSGFDLFNENTRVNFDGW